MRHTYFLFPLVLAGCSGSPEPKKQVVTPEVPGPEFISTAAPGRTPPRPIYDYHVAPAQYSLKPLDQWTEQEAAADALGRIGPQAVPQLIDALKSPDADQRLIAAQVLARMGSDAKEAVPALVKLLDDPDERIRKAAARTLGRIGPEASSAVPDLMRTLLDPAAPQGNGLRPVPSSQLP